MTQTLGVAAYPFLCIFSPSATDMSISKRFDGIDSISTADDLAKALEDGISAFRTFEADQCVLFTALFSLRFLTCRRSRLQEDRALRATQDREYQEFAREDQVWT